MDKNIKNSLSQGNHELIPEEELEGYLNQPSDNGHFVLDLEQAREERAEVILSKLQRKNN